MFSSRPPLLALTLFATAITALGADFRPFPGPEPVTMLQETYARGRRMGSDTPQCVLYANREALFFRTDGIYRHLLSEKEFSHVMRHVRAVAAVAPIKPFIDLAPGIHHEPSADFYVHVDQTTVVTRVKGISESGRPSVRRALPPGAKPDKLPPELASLYQVLHSLDFPDSERWIPKYIEVIAWPYEYAPERSIHWPKDWPSLTSDRAVKQGGDYSIYLAGHLLPQIDRLLNRRRPTGAILISGRKWMADRRPVFPSEHIWRRTKKQTLDRYFKSRR